MFDENISAFVLATGAVLLPVQPGRNAHYSVVTDAIYMPPVSFYPTPNDYSRVLLHECIHWTGGPNRLNRSFFPSVRPQEELIAEIGGRFLCRHFNIEREDSHLEYMLHWWAKLGHTEEAIKVASEEAGKALRYLGIPIRTK